MRMKRSAGIFSVLLASVMVLGAFGPVSAQAKETFEVSDRLVGEGELIESTEGLTLLSEEEEKELAAALGKKYSSDVIYDYNGTAKIKMKANMPVKQLGGNKMDVKADADAVFGESEADAMSMAECDIKVSIFLFSGEVNTLSYTDKKARREYRKTTTFGETEGWTYRAKEKTGSMDTAIPFLAPEKIREVYKDPASGSYAAVMELDKDDLDEVTGSGTEALADMGLDDSELEKGEYILTLDKGISVIGLYADLTKALKGDDMSVYDCKVRATIKDVNSDLIIILPEEAKSAKEKKK